MSDCKACDAEDVPLNSEGLCPKCSAVKPVEPLKLTGNMKIIKIVDDECEVEEQDPERWDGLS